MSQMAAFMYLRRMLFFNHPKDCIDFDEGLTVTCNESYLQTNESLE